MLHLRVMVIGESWYGSNCTALATGFRELGHTVDLIGSNEFIPRSHRRGVALALTRLVRRVFVREFNGYIMSQLRTCSPDLVVVYKGNWVRIETLRAIRRSGAWLCNMYPDVSMFGHPGLEPRSFVEYDHVFTTKSFGVEDLKRHFGIDRASFLPHGFDPLVHRPIPVPKDTDVSFIGTWSPHKARLLSRVADAIGAERIVVWGSQWERERGGTLGPALKLQAVLGDQYVEAISRARVNLGILSEQRRGASSGDQTTARTFEIPAAGGFMIHQRTQEVLQSFREGEEIACFETGDELVAQVRYYLEHEDERVTIARAGYERCRSEYSYTRRAEAIAVEYQRLRGGPAIVG